MGAGKPTGPTTELGRPGTATSIAPGLLPWSAFMDDREYAPDVRWPKSVQTYQRMQTDAQVKGLLMATTLPIRRFRWEIDPNGARPEVVEHVADSLNLPIRGQEAPPIRRRNRFSHDKHLSHALRSLAFGHFYFEQVFDYSDPAEGGDGRLHLRKLATRPPRTIANIITAEDGGLEAIQQNVQVQNRAGLGAAGLQGPVLSVDRLLAYVWDSEDDGDWIGRSMLRACFRDWLIKDALIRVDATKHERNAMGIPWFEVDPNASDEQVKDLAAIAERMRAGEQSGGAGSGKLRIAGVEGNLPDTIGSIRYHDQQMSRAFLLLFFDLGTTETGSRALGGDLIDWYTHGQSAIADHYRDVTQAHQIEDEVALNWGDDEQPPALVYTRLEGQELAFADLVSGVKEGVIAVDDELHAYIVQRFNLPRGTRPPAPAPEPPAPAPTPPPAPEPSSRAARPQRSAAAASLEAELRAPMRWPDLARAAGMDPKNGTARRARDELLAAGTIVRRANGTLAPASMAITLPDRDLRRQPLEFEVTAAVDFAAMDSGFLEARDQLVDIVAGAQAEQIDALASAVEAAAGDVGALARLSAEPLDPGLIEPTLQEIARQGAAQAEAEHEAQKPPDAQARPDAAAASEEEIESTVEERAEAVMLTLAAGLSLAASKRAAAVSALEPAAAAADVRAYLQGLSAAELELQLGGAAQQALNTGRKAYMRANDPSAVYASELLDANTCSECTSIDGTEWPSVEAAEGDYPVGGYINCEGGLRCRGTLVAIY